MADLEASTEAVAQAVLALFDRLVSMLIEKGLLTEDDLDQILGDVVDDLKASNNEHAEVIEQIFQHMYGLRH
jgi:hypothetical protein